MQSEFNFKGSDYNKERDGTRLANQFERIVNLVHGPKWWTLKEISEATGYMDGSISRQLRYAKQRGYILEKEHVENGLFRYRLKSKTLFQLK